MPHFQHLQYTDQNTTVDYFISGAANFIDPSEAHKEAVPPGSSRFHWANILALGGFGYVKATPSEMTFTFVEANGAELYTTTMHPRHH